MPTTLQTAFKFNALNLYKKRTDSLDKGYKLFETGKYLVFILTSEDMMDCDNATNVADWMKKHCTSEPCILHEAIAEL